MNLVFFGNGNRGVICLDVLLKEKWSISALVLHPELEGSMHPFSTLARTYKVPVFFPKSPNEPAFVEKMKSLSPDLFVLSGYGKIFKKPIISVPKRMCVNLHGGKLPRYRGSSPMNWALMEGASTFSISIICLNEGIDTGDILMEKTFPVGPEDSIKRSHEIANREFPRMLVEVLKKIGKGTLRPKKQKRTGAIYYPRRFPEDGFILWDMESAKDAHNKIRALTEPYPCAFTYFNTKKVILLASSIFGEEFRGEPGRIYRKENGRLLIGTKTKCLWITQAVFEESRKPLFDAIKMYDCLATVRAAMNKFYSS